MTEETKSTYGVRQFVVDMYDDVAAVRMAIKHIGQVQTVARYVSLVWGYISILLFTLYGVYQGFQTQMWGYSIGIFSLCAAMCIINTLLLCLHKHKGAEQVRRTVFHVFRIIAAFLKLSMAVVTVVGLMTVAAESSVTLRAVVCIASVFWLGVTLTADVVVFVLQIITDLLKDAVKERVERVQAVVKNTARPFVKGYRTVRSLSKILHLPRLKKRHSPPEKNIPVQVMNSEQATDTSHT